MENFMSDFNVFLNFFINGINLIWNWLISTILGKIIIFTVIISIFIYIINKLVSIGD